MQDSILQCTEDIEKQILDMDISGKGAAEAVEALGLSHMRISSASVIAIMDMFMDGITPINDEIVSAMLGICEAQKRFFFTLGGLLEESSQSLGRIKTKSAPAEEIQETEAEAAKAFEEPPAVSVEAENTTETEKPKATPQPRQFLPYVSALIDWTASSNWWANSW